MGAGGSLISFSLAYFFNFIILYRHAVNKKYIHADAIFFSLGNIKDVSQYLKYGIPSAFVLCLEWWCFEIVNIFAGWMGVNELDAAIGLSSFINFVTMIPQGISESVAISVGNSLGAGKPKWGIA